MTAPYSMDLRERALARKAAGETHREIAAGLQIAPSCVSKWMRRERETGSAAPAQVGATSRGRCPGRSPSGFGGGSRQGRSRCEG